MTAKPHLRQEIYEPSTHFFLIGKSSCNIHFGSIKVIVCGQNCEAKITARPPESNSTTIPLSMPSPKIMQKASNRLIFFPQ